MSEPLIVPAPMSMESVIATLKARGLIGVHKQGKCASARRNYGGPCNYAGRIPVRVNDTGEVLTVCWAHGKVLQSKGGWLRVSDVMRLVSPETVTVLFPPDAVRSRYYVGAA